MTASPNAVYENDLLGNREWRNRTTQGGLPAQRTVWDLAGRLQSACGPTSGAKYEYRADGMRTKKVEGLTLAWHWDDEEQSSGFWDENWNINKPTTRYWYDGQMPLEEDHATLNPGGSYQLFYGVGARGVEMIHRVAGTNQTLGYPIYDGHGNMVRTLTIDPVNRNNEALADAREYDAWGNVRYGAGTGLPGQRYCASLGHRQDDESGLIYMRARYYEPTTGRFVSEDPARDGGNWFSYGRNNPPNLADPSGTEASPLASLLVSLGTMLSFMSWGFAAGGNLPAALVAASWAVSLFALSLTAENLTGNGINIYHYGAAGAMNYLMRGGGWISGLLGLPSWTRGVLGVLTANVRAGSSIYQTQAVLMAVYTYSLLLVGALVAIDWD